MLLWHNLRIALQYPNMGFGPATEKFMMLVSGPRRKPPCPRSPASQDPKRTLCPRPQVNVSDSLAGSSDTYTYDLLQWHTVESNRPLFFASLSLSLSTTHIPTLHLDSVGFFLN